MRAEQSNDIKLKTIYILKGEIMTKTKKQINLARLIFDAYPHSDLLPINPEQDCRNLQTLLAKVTKENIGDSLFKFIVVEIVEGGESTLDGAIRVMERTREDLEAVLQALQARGTCLCTCEDYCKAAEYLAEQGRKIFTGPMKGGLWNARCMDACILSKKEDDKAAYEFLLTFGDKYAQQLSESQKLLWQETKDKAAAMFKTAESGGNKP